jgi:methylthioribose-1-phosphate isomerase
MGEAGADLLEDGDTVLTHCNAGALATADFGTALGVLYAAQQRGMKLKVIADETRPLLQGARLTSWELMKAGMDVTLICDNMAAHLMKAGRIQKVVVGADRIAMNGDTANKIGTYSVAVLAHFHHVPFYVAAPASTLDPDCPTGEGIPIEERDPSEVTEGFGKRTAPMGVQVFNPAFDVTPSALISGIITEVGVAKAPYEESLQKCLKLAKTF